ncbi:hypothetical protein KDW_17640 [Dictyobacter vulcani]|uniref:Uncharacterized protein n=1 Tax=Dictyobacter vulcani TaxID=2607529 RepID=A0A5J4KKL2_9CHLR|nr:hypothetical protein [Dictyobacter vulcani]GER87602.1 hypothetical protein KDW_17640 [Dictyobacter vulcani]
MSTQSAFHDRNAAIYMARAAIKELVANQAEQGRLQEIALDQKRYACHLALTTLHKYVAAGEVTIAMISRWVMEAVSNQARRDKKNTLTGQCVFDLWMTILMPGEEKSWSDFGKEGQALYSELAVALMEHLGICFDCGHHPSDGQLHEVAGLRICTNCLRPSAS